MATRRLRSILIDSTLGKIFTNTAEVTPSDPSKLIAGTKIQSTIISSPKKLSLVVSKNLGLTGAGKKFTSGALLTAATLDLMTTTMGASLIVLMKVGSTYETSTLAATLTLAAASRSQTTPLSITVQPNHAVFFDIAQVGTTRPGQGLSITLKYYAG